MSTRPTARRVGPGSSAGSAERSASIDPSAQPPTRPPPPTRRAPAAPPHATRRRSPGARASSRRAFHSPAPARARPRVVRLSWSDRRQPGRRGALRRSSAPRAAARAARYSRRAASLRSMSERWSSESTAVPLTGTRLRGRAPRLSEGGIGRGEARPLVACVGAGHIDIPPELDWDERGGRVGGVMGLHVPETRQRPTAPVNRRGQVPVDAGHRFVPPGRYPRSRHGRTGGARAAGW